MSQRRIIYLHSVPDGGRGRCAAASFPCPEPLSPSLPADCETILDLARRHLRSTRPELAATTRPKVNHALITTLTEKDTNALLRASGIRRLPDGTLASSANKVFQALTQQPPTLTSHTLPSLDPKKKTGHRAVVHGHGAADALDWDEAMALIASTYRDGRYMESVLVSCGCFLGLRISDLLGLCWHDICSAGTVTVQEKKTGKRRAVRITEGLAAHASKCRRNLPPDGDDGPVFRSRYKGDGSPITRQRADQILKELKARYGIRSANTFSTHSLRKTFGRRVWQVQCSKGRGEQALLLLCDVLGHSNVSITKRYLGIRQEEILSVYDELNR